MEMKRPIIDKITVKTYFVWKIKSKNSPIINIMKNKINIELPIMSYLEP